MVKNHLPVQKMRVPSLGWDDTLKKSVATHSSFPAWEIPWTEEPGGLQSMELHRVGHDLGTKQQQQMGPMLAQQYTCIYLFIGCATRLAGS